MVDQSILHCAQYNLGIMYLEGKGVTKDVKIALELLQQCSDEIPTAHNYIGDVFKQDYD